MVLHELYRTHGLFLDRHGPSSARGWPLGGPWVVRLVEPVGRPRAAHELPLGVLGRTWVVMTCCLRCRTLVVDEISVMPYGRPMVVEADIDRPTSCPWMVHERSVDVG